MDVLLVYGQIIGGLVLLYFGGDRLIRGASELAAHFGVSPLAIGLTVVALGTSAPELVVSIGAVMSGANDIAVGNVVGSNIANIALILGLAALIHPMNVATKVVRVDSPIMIAAALLLTGALISGEVSRLEGALLLVGLIAYVIFTFWEARKEPQLVEEEFASAVPVLRGKVWVSLFFVLVGLGMLVLGGQLLVTAAVKLASWWGVSQAVIGLTVVALGTSLPELTTSILAAYRGQGDLAIGNVVGSNIFNIFGILGTTAIIRPLELGSIGWLDLGMMVFLSCLVTVFLLTRLKLDRMEAGFLVLCFAAYTGFLFLG